MKRTFPIFLLITILALSAMACRLGSTSTIRPQPVLTAVPVLPNSIATPPPVVVSGSQEEILTNLYDRVSPGVVSIRVISDAGGSQGSGFVFDQAGHIVTNFHVVDGAKDIEVDFSSGLKVRGKVVGTDTDSDLAVIKVDASADQLFSLPLGNGEALRVGQTVVAIGNPFGLSGTMTVGIVSAKGRVLDSIRTSSQGNNFSAGDVIQTDAAINPGNSGGPLLNLSGEVVGINRAIRTTNTTAGGEPSNSGVGFAVNVDIIKRVVPELIKTGKYDYPYLGVSSSPEISLFQQEALGLPQATGAYITDVVSGGPADKAGLRAGTKSTSIAGLNAGGDLIIAVDGRPVTVFGDMLSYLMAQKSPGDVVNLTIIRNGEQKEVQVTLGKRP